MSNSTDIIEMSQRISGKSLTDQTKDYLESKVSNSTQNDRVPDASKMRQNDWEKRFEDMNRNCDGAYGCGQFPPEVKKFVAKELADARRGGYEEGYKRGFDRKPRPLSSSALEYQKKLIATLRKEETK